MGSLAAADMNGTVWLGRPQTPRQGRRSSFARSRMRAKGFLRLSQGKQIPWEKGGSVCQTPGLQWMDDQDILSKQQGAGLVATVRGWRINYGVWQLLMVATASAFRAVYTLPQSFLISSVPRRERKLQTIDSKSWPLLPTGPASPSSNRKPICFTWAQSRLALGGLACSMSKDYPHQLSRNDAFRTILGCTIQDHFQGFEGFASHDAGQRVPIPIAKVYIACGFTV